MYLGWNNRRRVVSSIGFRIRVQDWTSDFSCLSNWLKQPKKKEQKGGRGSPFSHQKDHDRGCSSGVSPTLSPTSHTREREGQRCTATTSTAGRQSMHLCADFSPHHDRERGRDRVRRWSKVREGTGTAATQWRRQGARAAGASGGNPLTNRWAVWARNRSRKTGP